MTSSARALSIAAAIAVACQGLASTGAVLVCRWTGQVVAPSECPTGPARGAPLSAVKTESCCELRSAPATAAPAARSPATSSPTGPLVQVFALPPDPPSPAAGDALPLGLARHHDPPRTPLYLSVRSLLI